MMQTQQRLNAVNTSKTNFLTVNYQQSKKENESANEADASCKDELPEELNLFTPFSSSHSNTITTNSSFIFDSEEELLDLHNQYSDDTDCEDCDECDTDCIPLIDRITPPPPLFLAEYPYDARSDQEEAEEHHYEAYHIEYQYHGDEHVYEDEEDEDESDEQRHKLLRNLSIVIPTESSTNLICKASPAKSSKSKRFLFDTCTTATPNSCDHEQMQHEHEELGVPNMYKLACSSNTDAECDDDAWIQNKQAIENRQQRGVEKRFNWNFASEDNNGYQLNHYLNAHIESLLDETFSE
eukprot:CAMPEP_0197020924 /NCGR_PEP_ID=MMETSP1384-20130603/1784_1 /TAXON_ID=29189 /ORGANISM="Ammonia sp." /LENGTH=295 /DNA_ID=CAMNT_0042448649 /DNA_START=105 /DNA_END=992 /DNA_ORIENTATION=+